MDGILLVDKPAGWTSHDVVAKVRSMLRRSQVASHKSLETGDQRQETPLRKVKVGHSGTLDPLATGLMVILVGSYCKRAQEFSKLDKTYEVTMKLGEVSTTGDEEGVKSKVETRKFKETEITEVLDSFLGESMQTPPAYSAIKVDGKRAYKLAREGKKVELEPRKVRINSIKLNKYDHPYIEFTVDVSSGTYIRSLVEDIAKKLGTGAYMTNLRRTKVGQFLLEKGIPINQLEKTGVDEEVIRVDE